MICRHGAKRETGPIASVLVLNWNGLRFLAPCLSSVLADACDHVEVVLIDNGSADGSVALVGAQFPNVKIIQHKTNLGFSVGYNVAVPRTRGQILVFLNNDTVVSKGWLDPLVEPLQKQSQVGLTTSKILFFGTNRINAAGGKLKLWTGANELGYGFDEALFSEPGLEPFFALGAAMAIRRSLFRQLGGFDDGIFAYGEDVDLSWRARLLGYKVSYVPQSIVYHHHSGTLSVFNPSKVRMVTRGQLIAMIKSLSIFNLAHSLPAYAVFALLKGATLAVVRRDSRFVWSVVLGFVDIARAGRTIWQKRRSAQTTRHLPDATLLQSAGFGLVESPGEFWRILKVAREISAYGTVASHPHPVAGRPDPVDAQVARLGDPVTDEQVSQQGRGSA